MQNLSIGSNSKPSISTPLPYNGIYFNTPSSSKLSFPLKCSRIIEHIFPSFQCLMHIYSFCNSVVINMSILIEHESFGASYRIPSTVSRSFRTSLFTCAFISFLYSISCLRTCERWRLVFVFPNPDYNTLAGLLDRGSCKALVDFCLIV